MQTILLYEGKLKDSDMVLEQRIPISDQSVLQDPAKLVFTIQQQLVTLGIGGMVHKVGNRMVLTPGARFENIWCEIPSIMLASPGDSIATGR